MCVCMRVSKGGRVSVGSKGVRKGGRVGDSSDRVSDKSGDGGWGGVEMGNSVTKHETHDNRITWAIL